MSCLFFKECSIPRLGYTDFVLQESKMISVFYVKKSRKPWSISSSVIESPATLGITVVSGGTTHFACLRNQWRASSLGWILLCSSLTKSFGVLCSMSLLGQFGIFGMRSFSKVWNWIGRLKKETYMALKIVDQELVSELHHPNGPLLTVWATSHVGIGG